MKTFKQFVLERDIDFDGGSLSFPYNNVADKLLNRTVKKRIDVLVKHFNEHIQGTIKGDAKSYTIDDYNVVTKHLKREYNDDEETSDKFSKKSLSIVIDDINIVAFKKFAWFLKRELNIMDRELLIIHNTMKSHRYV